MLKMTESEDQTTHSVQTVKMRRYVDYYYIIYSTGMVLMVGVIYFFKITTGRHMALALAAMASLLAAKRFVDDTSRAPTLRETGIFSAAACGWATVFSVLLFLVRVGLESIAKNQNMLFVLRVGWQEMQLLLLGVLVVIVVSNYLVIRCCFSWYAKKLYLQGDKELKRAARRSGRK